MLHTRFPFKLRWAREGEWDNAMRLVWRTFLKYDGCDYTDEGIENFHEFITDTALQASFLRGEYQMMVALDDNKIIGVASIRSINHLSLLFVDEEYHKRGVGRALILMLCNYLKIEVGEQYMSLKASPYAVNFYRKLGFQATSPEEEYSGIRVTSMEKVL